MGVVSLFVFSPSSSLAQQVDCSAERCATCDLCGFCQNNPTPGNWEKCRNCLYPLLTSNPAQNNQTLKIEPTTNMVVTPQPGRWYTQIGCLSSNLGGFSQSGGAASPIQMLLNFIFTITGGIALLYFMYGSFLVLTSQGEYEKLNRGKQVIIGGVTGLIISLSVVFLVNIIIGKILRVPGF